MGLRETREWARTVRLCLALKAHHCPPPQFVNILEAIRWRKMVESKWPKEGKEATVETETEMALRSRRWRKGVLGQRQ